MMKRLDKEAYDKAQRGYVAPEPLALPGLETQGVGRSMLSNLKKALAAKLAKGQALVQEKIIARVTEKQNSVTKPSGASDSVRAESSKSSQRPSKSPRSPKSQL